MPEKKSAVATKDASLRPPTVWFEVGTYLRHFDNEAHVTGMERVGFEIYNACAALAGANVGVQFCRLSPYTGAWETVNAARVLRPVPRGRIARTRTSRAVIDGIVRKV